MNEAEKTAKILDDATLQKKEVKRFTLENPALSIEKAYDIQNIGIELRLARSEKIIGYKMGLTSRAKMKQMGVHSPIAGVLTVAMWVKDDETLAFDNFIHPKIEPEIAFRMGKDIKGKPSFEEAIEAIEAVFPAMEIIDSRYLNFEFKLPDVIADNCSSRAFVLGKEIRDFQKLDLGNLGMVMSVNGDEKLFGSSAAILGNPVESLIELCSLLEAQGKLLPTGSIVLAGAATQAMLVEMGSTYLTEIQNLGKVSVRFE